MSKKPRDPFEPFATVIFLGVALYVGVLLFALLRTVVGRTGVGRTLFGGSGFEQGVCVQSNEITLETGNPPGPPIPFRPDVTATPQATNLCVRHATAGQHILDTLTTLPDWIFYGVTLALLWWLLSGARRHGPFHIANANRVRFIGWWLIVGGIVAPTVQNAAHHLLISTMMQPPYATGWSNPVPALSVSAILTGLGLLVIARILKVGAQMHDDLAGTV